MKLIFTVVTLVFLASCGDLFTDAATRIAYDLESASEELGSREGVRYRLEHRTPSKRGECDGPYKVQLDQVGALIVWCYDSSGNTVSSHSTSYHARFVDTPKTWLVDKAAHETLIIELERRDGRAQIIDVR